MRRRRVRGKGFWRADFHVPSDVLGPPRAQGSKSKSQMTYHLWDGTTAWTAWRLSLILNRNVAQFGLYWRTEGHDAAAEDRARPLAHSPRTGPNVWAEDKGRAHRLSPPQCVFYPVRSRGWLQTTQNHGWPAGTFVHEHVILAVREGLLQTRAAITGACLRRSTHATSGTHTVLLLIFQ